MTISYVITERCIDVKDSSCTQACPVDCIYEGGRMFYIHPDECINCGLCLSICPVDAIVWEGDLTDDDTKYLAISKEFFSDVTGWGSPRGWSPQYTTTLDHPVIENFAKHAE